jgi:hypothetical protein
MFSVSAGIGAGDEVEGSGDEVEGNGDEVEDGGEADEVCVVELADSRLTEHKLPGPHAEGMESGGKLEVGELLGSVGNGCGLEVVVPEVVGSRLLEDIEDAGSVVSMVDDHGEVDVFDDDIDEGGQ